MISVEGARILRRVVNPEEGSIPRVLAEFLARLDFRPMDHKRYTELSMKAQDGTLTNAERRQLESYLEVDGLLSLLRLAAEASLGDTLE
jgi:hypothetical protein